MFENFGKDILLDEFGDISVLFGDVIQIVGQDVLLQDITNRIYINKGEITDSQFTGIEWEKYIGQKLTDFEISNLEDDITEELKKDNRLLDAKAVVVGMDENSIKINIKGISADDLKTFDFIFVKT